MFNTPNTFGIFALDRVLSWLERLGGVDGIEEKNRSKAALIYDQLDSSDFWAPHSEEGSRSLMNVTWRIADNSLESVFLSEAVEQRLSGLKGHRSVGGLRASIYNACPTESVEALVAFMADFERRHG
jgi:phosphoserine aminotransferase